MRYYYVYILASRPNGTLYVGVTNNLERRMFEHRSGMGSGFASRYGIKTLVYFEEFGNVNDAIMREKEVKGWLRKKKVDLINKSNPGWIDLDSSLRSE